jgi:NAD(P)H-hydrate epimerase
MIQLWNSKHSDQLSVMSRLQVRAFDAWAIEQMHIPGAVLMENAGRGAAQCLLDNMHAISRPRAALFCGSGNNGGDGYVIARHLANAGIDVVIVLCSNRDRIRGDADIHLKIAEAMGLPICTLNWEKNLLRQVQQITAGAHWIVDALLGTGLQGQVNDPMARLICALNTVDMPILSVDIPSGLDCDRGIPLPICIQAAMTVTFAALKKGFIENPDCHQVAGRIYIASIGISPCRMRGA